MKCDDCGANYCCTVTSKAVFPPLRMHGENESLYTDDGFHWYYKGEKMVFENAEVYKCPVCGKVT